MRNFRRDNPFGACPKCAGLGVFMRPSRELIVPDENLSVSEGAIQATGWSKADGGTIAQMYFEGVINAYGGSMTTPFKDLPKKTQDALLYGTEGKKIKMERRSEYGSGTYMSEFEGVINNLQRRYNETTSDWSRNDIEQYMTNVSCPECGGARLKKESLFVTVGDINIDELCHKTMNGVLDFFDNLKLSKRDEFIAKAIVKEIKDRITFLSSVGLEYLSLSRSAGTLSGGESQRIRLATQIGSSLMGVLYVLDEPSIGLHQKDNEKLLETLRRLRDLGNTLIVVEHDEDTMRAADYIVDIGPGAGIHGGNVVCCGSAEDIMNCEESITGQYLSGKKKIPVPESRRKGNGKFLSVFGAAQNNLQNIDVKLPLGEFICITGVSGSGKSSLVNEIIYKKLAAELNRAKKFPGKHDHFEGIENLDKIIDIDQSPIGRSPRSNPATYVGVFDDIRNLYAQTKDAKLKGYKSGRFSFNVKGGRCEACQGDGIVKIKMHFLPDIYVPCEICGGTRYNSETLSVKYKGKSIYDVLEMTIEEATEFFSSVPRIHKKLLTLCEVGLGYVKVGQPATTLSGGEAQRVKLATELSRQNTGRTIYVLDEPTTGLHTADVHRLIDVLQRLVDTGSTVLVIEHNLDVIKVADHIIDLGPDGGSNGGRIVAEGTPEDVAKVSGSYTGQYLKKMLEE